MSMIKSFIKEESGATIIEYALLVALLSIAAVGILPTLGASATGAFTTVNGEFS